MNEIVFFVSVDLSRIAGNIHILISELADFCSSDNSDIFGVILNVFYGN